MALFIYAIELVNLAYLLFLFVRLSERRTRLRHVLVSFTLLLYSSLRRISYRTITLRRSDVPYALGTQKGCPSIVRFYLVRSIF